ncbi:major facilitator superfamily domain-containing protein [Microdochium trichocladiopsis]|uniref:Major facilitator superfamily domain-containing protein n=1 Tax=Microdochium trichocladiopsis TaxID=1682393 RepID=A0A9P9BWT1_9PEZI|nr:major facilitator superfamily domain-containing protein [Microdochium trichocladiopsis]KAH7035401.1 major facilitator superfamily domain-containing protein [Microdochium trichocladiopsis]
MGGNSPANDDEGENHNASTTMASPKFPPADNVIRTADEIEKPHVHGDSDSDGHSITSHKDGNGVAIPISLQRTISRLSGSRSPSRTPSRTISLIHDGIETRHEPSPSIDLAEVELGPELQEKKTTTAPDPSDPNLVTWSDPGENPKNWPFARKWVVVFITSMFTLMSPLSSTIIAPALTTIGKDFGIDDPAIQFLTLSIFILGFSVGPLLWGPASEIYGRVIVLQLTNAVFFGFNLGCGLSQNKEQLIVFRFLAGLTGSASLATGGGVMGDLFVAEERGRAMSVYSLAPLLGPALGPICGGFIVQYAQWRWAFYATTIFDALIQCAGLFLLRETYAPVLLAWKKKKLAKETGNTELHTPFDSVKRTAGEIIRTAISRPFRMLATQVIVQFMAMYLMFLYGVVYIMLSSFPGLWSGPEPDGYGMSISIGGLNYISLGVGFWAGAQTCARLQDRIYAAMKRRNGGVGEPEFRVLMMAPGAVLTPIGLLIYGWTAEYKTHWIGPNIGAFVFGLGSIIGFNCVQTFLVDVYTRYAASAVGATTVLRGLAGFAFPLFVPKMYARLGLGFSNTVLAACAVAIGWPGPVFLWFYGKKLRQRSPFAAGS